LEAGEGFEYTLVAQSVGALCRPVGFDEAAAAKGPGGVDENFELVEFEAADGIDLGEESGVEECEFALFAGGDEVLLGTESVLDGVAGRSRFTCFGPGACR